ncbi:hypothetical protein [Brucella thiophenivorans]|nr:hypothetical protein [Brucella thiophenivorans]
MESQHSYKDTCVIIGLLGTQRVSMALQVWSREIIHRPDKMPSGGIYEPNGRQHGFAKQSPFFQKPKANGL